MYVIVIIAISYYRNISYFVINNYIAKNNVYTKQCYHISYLNPTKCNIYLYEYYGFIARPLFRLEKVKP